MGRLKDKVAIIVGTTSGIGEAMAKLFASEGANVILTGRRENKGKKIEADIRNSGGKADFFQADATKKADLERLVNFVIDKYGRIDILCNNAGIAMSSDFTAMDMEQEYDQTMATNVRSYLLMMQLVIPHMQKAKKGAIVNTASVAAISAMPYQIAYAASKAAVEQVTRSLARRYASEGIRLNCILPGLTHSEMVVEGGDFEKAVLPSVPMGRAAEATEIAQGALFPASDDASYCTGVSLVIDGGTTL